MDIVLSICEISYIENQPPDILSNLLVKNWGLLFVWPECIGVRLNCNFVQRKSKYNLVQD